MKLSFKIYKEQESLPAKTLDRDVIKIGRQSSCHLHLDDDTVSRMHAVVEVAEGGQISIIDLGSDEGTYVNGKRVNKVELKSGDEIRLGKFWFIFRQGDLLCPVCGHQVDGAERACPDCESAHHEECWLLNDGCGGCKVA